jgi:acetyl esterase/lipase
MNQLSAIVACIFACAMLLWACTKEDTNPPAKTSNEARMNNVSYGSNDRNKMDVALPKDRNENTPFVLLIHGGGWVSGDKGDMKAIQDSLLLRGIASAAMNYRFASGSIHYEQLMDDVSNALDVCVSKAGEWKIRNDKYVIGGASAGAHMSLLYAHRYNTKHSISAVVSAAGPTDLTDIDWLNYTGIIGQLGNIQSMVGAQYYLGQSLDPRFAAASPIKAVKNIPTLMIHGDADLVVAYAQSQRMAAVMNNSSFTNNLVTIPGAGHDLGVGNPTNAKLVVNEISAWVNTYGK